MIDDILMVSCAILCRKEGMAKYFKKRCNRFALITVASRLSKSIEPKCELFSKGELVKSFKLIIFPGFLLDRNKYLVHIGYIISIIYAALRLRRRFYLYIGEGHIYTLTGIFLKFLGICKRVIYSSGDYFTDVKSFQIIDKFISGRVDAIWSASTEMEKERESMISRFKEGSVRLVMPLGVEIQYEAIKKNELDKRNVLFIGNLQKHQGLDLFLDVMPGLLKKIPDLSLHVIGSGIHEENLKRKVKDLNLGNQVTFYGFVQCEDKIKEIFSSCSLGIALYNAQEAGFTRLSDPGKIKDYLSYGLPVLTTAVPQFSEEILRRKAGWVVGYERASLRERLLEIFNDPTALKIRAQNARSLAEDYSWDKILDNVWEQTLKIWQ